MQGVETAVESISESEAFLNTLLVGQYGWITPAPA